MVIRRQLIPVTTGTFRRVLGIALFFAAAGHAEPPRVAFGPTTIARYSMSAFYNTLGGPAISDFSGCTIMPQTGEIMVIVNNPEYIEVFDPDGTYKRVITLTGFDDTEGICLYNAASNLYAIVEERIAEMSIIEVTPSTTNINKSSATVIPLGLGNLANTGIEGVAYDPTSNCFYFVKEKFPMAVYRRNDTGTNAVTTVLFDPEVKLAGKTTDLSDCFFDAHTRHLFVMGDETKVILECDLQGNVIASLPLDAGQPEGLVFTDDRARFYMVSEPNHMYVYSIASWAATCPEGTVCFAPLALSAPATNDVTVGFVISTTNATPGSDFTPTTGTVAFSAGAMTNSIAVSCLKDLILEAPEHLAIALTNPVNASLKDAQETFTLTIADMGRLEWSPVSTQYLNIPFNATITARDADGAVLTGFNGTATLSASADRPVASSVLITEASSDTPDFVEIQNVSGSVLDTRGWVVAVNDASWSDINSVHSTVWSLPSTMATNQVLYRTDSASDNPWGANIWWAAGAPGWVMILDDEGRIVDFAVWGYTAATISEMDVTINGFNVSIGTAWSGDGVADNLSSLASLQRVGNSDSNNAADFVCTTMSKGTKNASLTVPFPGASAALAFVPQITGNFSNGVWSGTITIQELASNVVITANDGREHWGSTAKFNIEATPPVRLILPASVTEGNGVLQNAGQAFLLFPALSNTVVTLSSDDPSEITVPGSVTILAGNTNAVFDVTVVNDALLDGTQNANITATAAGLSDGRGTIAVADNETAVLTLTLPAAATEGNGVLTNQGQVTIEATAGANISVSLSCSDTSEVVVPPVVTIQSGQSNASFNVTAVDDTAIDGARQANVTAHVDGWTDGFDTMNIADNETTNLTLFLTSPVLENAGVVANAGKLSISGTWTSSLLVTLASDFPAKLVLTNAVAIPAGSTGAWFSYSVQDDSARTNNRPANVLATVAGFTAASGTVTVTDNEAEIRGMKWHDSNTNGVKDPGEAAVNGWRFFVDSDSDSVWDPGEAFALSDASGAYSILANAGPGLKITEESRQGWRQAYPAGSSSASYSNTLSQLGTCYSPNVLTFSFTNAAAPSGPGTLLVYAVADLDLATETISLNAESTIVSNLWVTGGLQMSPVSTVVALSQANLAGLASDGTVTFTMTPSAGVNNLIGTEELTLTLQYPAARNIYVADISYGGLLTNCNFGNTITNLSCDSDSDGMTDARELIANTGPFNAASILKMTGIVREGSDIRLNWQGGVTATQVVEWSTNIAAAPPVWSALRTNYPPTMTNAFTDTSSTNPTRHYRIRAR